MLKKGNVVFARYRYMNIISKLFPIQMRVRNSVFSREFANKFPLHGGNLKISRGGSPREIFKIPRIFSNSGRAREFIFIFFYRLFLGDL